MKQVVRRRISTKIALILGGILLVVFVGLSIVIARLSGSSTSEAIHDEMANLARANGKEAQAVLDCAAVQAASLHDYVLKGYEQNTLGTASPSSAKRKSMAYDARLSDLSIEHENFLVKSMWSAVLSNEDLVGLGVYFEPDQFDRAISDYTLYVNKADALGRIAESEGEYANYAEQDYYQPAKETLMPHFTDPYQEEGQEEGVIMITAVYPILYQNVFRGVVLADINVWKFSQIITASEEYPSLAGSILTDEFTIIYDSQSNENVGLSLAEFEKDPAEMQKIIDGAAAGEAFFRNTVHADGRALTQFFYPIQVGDRTWWAQTSVDTADLTKAA